MKILLPVDGSEVSLNAVRFVIKLAMDGLQTSVVLANVQEPSSLYEMVVVQDPETLQRASAAAGVHTLEAARVLLVEAHIEVEREVASGEPAHTIVDIVERFGCDMVVMGASGTSSLRSALLGSVSNEVLHAAGVPVVSVKSFPSETDVTEPTGDEDASEA